MEHHDAITGTAKDFVNADYFQRLQEGTSAALQTASQALAFLVRINENKKTPTMVGLDFSPLNQTGFSPIQSLFKASPEDEYVPMIIYNSLAWERSEIVRIEGVEPPTNRTVFLVLDELGNTVPSQLLPRGRQPTGGGLAPGYDLYFEAQNIPPLGWNTYFITTPASSPSASPTTTKTSAANSLNEPVILQNGVYSMTLLWNEAVGYYKLSSVVNKLTGKTYNVTARLMEYVAYMDGAYILSTRQQAVEVVAPTGSTLQWQLSQGAVVQQFTQFISDNITQTFRLYNAGDVALNGSSDFVGRFLEIFHSAALAENREMILRFDVTPDSTAWGADLTGGLFFSDNGVELLHRPRDIIRFGDTSERNIIAGGYYPVQATALLRSNVTTGGELVLLTRQSVGASSQLNNSIEVLFHRRTSYDDGRGVGEPLNDTSRLNIPFRYSLFLFVLFFHNSLVPRILLDDIEKAEAHRVAQSLSFEYPLQVFYVDTSKYVSPLVDYTDWTDDYVASYNPVSGSAHPFSTFPVS